MRKLHLIKDKKIREYINKLNLPTYILIEYLIKNVDDFKNIKLKKDFKNTCLLDLNIKKAWLFGYNFEYELIK